MKRLLVIMLLIPLLGSAQVTRFMGRYDVSKVDSVNDSIWKLTGTFVDVTGSWTGLDADTGDKIIQRGYNSTGKVVFDRYVVTGISSATAVNLEVFIKSDYSSGVQNMVGMPFTGSFPIASPTSDTMKTTYRASFYQNSIDPDYDAALDNLNLLSIYDTPETDPHYAADSGAIKDTLDTHNARINNLVKYDNRYEINVSSDSENNWILPFDLRSNSIIIYNGDPLKSTQWSSASPAILTVNVDVRKYDHIVLIN